MQVSEEKIHKIFHAGLIFLLLIAVLLGCNLPQRILTPSPDSTHLPGGLTGDVPSITSPISTITSVSTQPHVVQTTNPQITSTAPPATPAAPSKIATQYHLAAILDYEMHSLSVAETIDYTNLTNAALTDLLLVVEPNLIPGGFTLISIAWENGESIAEFELTKNQLLVPMLQPMLPGDQLEIVMNFQLDLPVLADTSIPSRPEAYGYSERQTNLVDWYPYVPPYVNGEGWLIHSTWYLGEYQVYDEADYFVTFTLAHPIEGLVLAASAPAVQDGEQYSYQLRSGRTFALSASTEYLVQTADIGDTTIFSYSFPYDKSAGQQVLSDTTDAVQIYSEVINPYQRSSLSIVEADFLDGMEYDGLFFLSHGFYDLYDGSRKGYLTFIAAHETAHQWWYGLVGNDQALEPWLDEAMCTYMEKIYYEYISYEYQPHQQIALVDWWWYYRVNFYNPQGWVDGSIYDFDNSLSYRNAVYLNGAKFINDLRKLMGDEAFFAFLKDYALNNAHNIATANDFFTLVRAHTTQDLSELIYTYFQGNK